MAFHQLYNSQGNFHYNAYIYTDTDWSSHFHACYELIYAMENTVEVTANGCNVVLYQGEFFLIPPYTVHSMVIPKNVKTWVGVFSGDFVVDFAKKHKYTRFSKFRCDSNIQTIIKNNLLFQGTPEHYTTIGCLNMVCGQCLKNATEAVSDKGGEFTYKIIEYICDNLAQDLTLKGLADSLKYEYHYFSSLFHACFQVNFKAFINMLRFEKACGLLADKSQDITDICAKCGFGSIRNFNRVFKLMSGITPSTYRQRLISDYSK